MRIIRFISYEHVYIYPHLIPLHFTCTLFVAAISAPASNNCTTADCPRDAADRCKAVSPSYTTKHNH